MIKLIATDLDGTLLTSTRQISARTIQILEAAREAGIWIVPASGRQPFSIADVVEGTFLDEGLVLGANGAVGYHLGRRELIFEELLSVEAQTALYCALVQRFPGVRCASIRAGGAQYFPQFGYVGFMDPGDHVRGEELQEYPLEQVLDAPSVKLVVRSPEVAPEDLLAACRDLNMEGVAPSISGAAFLEVAAAGVDKASGLARLVQSLGIESHEVVAFGDNHNDIEMLSWAGLGVAMGNAVPEALAAANAIALTNDEDGLAVFLEGLASKGWEPGYSQVPAEQLANQVP